MKLNQYYIYILTNKNNTVLYIGVTNDLTRRVSEHRQKLVKGFTSKYNVDKLIYFEKFNFIVAAIAREKQLKGYSRAKKNGLINKFNPEWLELYNNGKIEIPKLDIKADSSSQVE